MKMKGSPINVLYQSRTTWVEEETELNSVDKLAAESVSVKGKQNTLLWRKESRSRGGKHKTGQMIKL